MDIKGSSILQEALNLLDHGDTDAALSCLLETIKLEPDNLEAYNALGVIYSMNSPEKATRCFLKALSINPSYPQALYNLANLYKNTGLFEDAIKLYNSALSYDPSIYQAYYNIGNIMLETFRYNQAMDLYLKAIELRHDYAEALTNLGVCYYHQGLVMESIEQYKRAIEANSNYCDAHFNLALALLMLGDYKNGWIEYQWRLRLPQFKRDTVSEPMWDGSDLIGKRLFIYAEQGYGDTIQFVRYLSILSDRGIKIILQCPGALKSLFMSTFVDVVIVESEPAKDYYHSYCPLLELPRLLNTEINTIPAKTPYITPSEEIVRRFHGLLNSLNYLNNLWLKVGIAWKGSRSNRRGFYRSMSVDDLMPILSIGGVNFISLINEPVSGQYNQLNLIDLSEYLTDFNSTAGLIANLDLIITIDTAVAHLAGAMGKPVWLMLHYISDWRWMLNRTDSPWYPTMRIFRQKDADNWASVVDEIYQGLLRLVSHNTKKDAVAVSLTNADAHWQNALSMLRKGRFKEGWRQYEWRRQIGICRGYYPDIPLLQWEGQDLDGKGILVYDEQGFGDAIQFIRFTDKLLQKGARVYMLCRRELYRLFSTFIKEIETLERGTDFSIAADFMCPLMSLPLYLDINRDGLSIETPYFKISHEDIKRWGEIFTSDTEMLRLGLSWKGRHEHPNDSNRSIGIEILTSLTDTAGASFYSLQRSDTIEGHSKIHDYTREFIDFYDTATFISHLDIIVTVDTAVAHLAGALGKETWLLLPFESDWRWFDDNENTVWYPTMRIFRQKAQGCWEDVISRVKTKLIERFRLHGI